MNRQNVFKLLLINLSLLMILSGCDIFSQTESEYATVSIGIPSSRSFTDYIDNYILTVTADDIEDKTITFTNSTTTFDIKKGSDRTFSLVGYDTDGNTVFKGETTTNLVSGTNNIIIDITFVGYSLYTYYQFDVDVPDNNIEYSITIIDGIISMSFRSYEYELNSYEEDYRGTEYTLTTNDNVITIYTNDHYFKFSFVDSDSGTYTISDSDEYNVTYEGDFISGTGSPLTDIIDFETQDYYTGYIDGLNITIEYYEGDITAITPTITIPLGATISPASGVEQDFTSPVKYTVTAQDGTTAVYTASVTIPQ